jgi:ketosteroid isomerase-like protein
MKEDLDQLIERYHRALSEFMTGNPQLAVACFARRDDITLANPFGPVACGPNQVKLAAERAAMNYRGGHATSFEPLALRVTSIFGREADGWKLLHRHADPITTAQSPESVLPR